MNIRPAVELSKMYVLPAHHGSGVAAALMDAALEPPPNGGAPVAYGSVSTRKTNALNGFTSKHGFTVSGNRSFQLGDHIESDYVMVRPF